MSTPRFLRLTKGLCSQAFAAWDGAGGPDTVDLPTPYGVYRVDLANMTQAPQGKPKRVRNIRRSKPKPKMHRTRSMASVALLAVAPGAGAGAPAAAAAGGADRGVQPPQITLSTDGKEMVVGRGLMGISDPYMSSRQVELSARHAADGSTTVRMVALGRNACLAFDPVSGEPTRIGAGGSAQQCELQPGQEFCLLHDGTMRYRVSPGSSATLSL